MKISSEKSFNSLEDQLFGLRLMKFGLFGWFNKRLAQSEEDQDFIRNNRIDFISRYPYAFGALLFFYILFKASWEHTHVVYGAVFDFDRRTKPETLKGMSVRFTWFDLVKSLATFDTPFLPYAKLGALSGGRRRAYDPETNRHDSVSSNE